MGQTDKVKGLTSIHHNLPTDFLVSMMLLGSILIFVLGGLAHDANWRKFTRISIASLTYSTILLTPLTKWSRDKRNAGTTLPFWPFAIAALFAELASGWLRPGMRPAITFWVAPVAALLIGGVHWLALHKWRPLREQIVASKVAKGQTSF